MIKEAYGMYIANLECSLVSDKKKFWNFVKCRKGSGTVTGNDFVWNDKRLRDGLSIAGAFAEYFGSVYDKTGSVKLEGGTFIACYGRSATFNYFEYNY